MTSREIEKLSEEGKEALKEKLGLEGMIKFLQLLGNGKGDYTEERAELLKDVTIEEFEKFIARGYNS